MSQIVKAFLGVFLTLFIAVVAMGVLTTYMEVMNAQDMQARIIDELENSNFNVAVMQACFQQCEKAGYDLSVTLFSEGTVVTAIHSKQEVPASLISVTVARVEMKFPMKSAFLGIDQSRTFVGYAR